MTAGRWTIPVPLLPGESLSSWLARAALTQGCDPPVLTGVVAQRFGAVGWGLWSTDVDRGLPPQWRAALAEVSGIPPAALERASLRPEAERMGGVALPEYGAWPWVLTLGARSRKRVGGQTYCPACLAQDARPYFRKAWRFAWQVGCPRHGVGLEDGCPRCGAPVEPHRLSAEDRHLARCARCKAELRGEGRPLGGPALGFQAMAEEALRGGVGRWGERAMPAEDWFALTRYLVSLLRHAARHPTSAPARAFRWLPPLPTTGLPLELLPVGERQALLAPVGLLLRSDPEEVVRAAAAAGMTQGTLRGIRRPLPPVVAELFATLPEGSRPRGPVSPRRAPAGPRPQGAVQRAWARLRRKLRLLEG